MPTPVILDCDPGTDDAIAILLALASPELSVLAITVAGGNVGLEHTLANALALTKLAGSAVPVHAGAHRPLLGAFETWAGWVRRAHSGSVHLYVAYGAVALAVVLAVAR